MTEPTIISSGKYQLAKLQFQGREPLLGFRESKDSSWVVASFADLLGVFYISSNDVQSSQWYDFAVPANWIGSLNPSIGTVRVKGASSRSPLSVDGRGLPRDILFGIGGTGFNIRIESEQSRQDLLIVLSQLQFQFAQMVPIDADSSEMSKGVDYGRA